MPLVFPITVKSTYMCTVTWGRGNGHGHNGQISTIKKTLLATVTCTSQ